MITKIFHACIFAEEGEGLYTPRSRRRASNASGITTLGGGGGGGNKSRRSSGATHRTLRGIDEHPLDHEEVHIERLRNKRTFPGYIMPDDLVPKAFKVH